MNGILLQHGYLIAKIKADEDTRELYYKILKASITKENKEDLIRFIANSEKESLKQYRNCQQIEEEVRTKCFCLNFKKHVCDTRTED
jgi:hypothetical protein